MSKYIFVAGAPGSKWSSVVNGLYNYGNFNLTDQEASREYWHSAWGRPQLMHKGAYFDPGMEFGKSFARMHQLTKEELEEEFDSPFGKHAYPNKIIKSHVFCHHLDFLRDNWPDCPIVLVYRPNDACLGWWVRCGHFNITYPNYQYYSNLEMMAMHINQQNRDLLDFMVRKMVTFDIANTRELLDKLNATSSLSIHDGDGQQYAKDDIQVAVVK